jgi:hypothetical protein
MVAAGVRKSISTGTPVSIGRQRLIDGESKKSLLVRSGESLDA